MLRPNSMCGIVGFTGRPNPNLLDRLNASLAHRGPDEAGAKVLPIPSEQDAIHLAMSRLSILDLGGGHQPMQTADGATWIVYNGEVYNAPELRRELEAQGVTFQTQNSDTEVVLKLYERYGTEMLSRLNGMFAFVIYDSRHKQLFCARDRMGIKPFYYIHNRHFAFASELKTLLLYQKEVEGTRPSLQKQAVYDFFTFQCIPAPLTPIEGVLKLEPATYLILDLTTHRLQKTKYWAPSFEARTPVPPAELPKWILMRLKEAVGRWSLSDVPVACSLSGGIDSAAIVAIMAEQHSDLRTFTLGFRGKNQTPHALDETEFARLVAKRYGTNHTEIIVEPTDLLKEWPAMIHSLDEPYAGGLPSWFVFKEMAKHVKVGFTGTGGDELFGNYGKWIPYEYFHRRVKRLVRHAWVDGHEFSDYPKFPIGYLYHVYFRDAFKRRALFNAAWAEAVTPSEKLIEDLWKQAMPPHPRNAVGFVDFSIQLPEEFLHMTDRFSMAHSLEARTPFLDHEFVEHIQHLPAEIRTSPSNLKHLLKDAVRSLLPPELLTLRKRGFVLPIGEWLRGPLQEEARALLSDAFIAKQGIFRAGLTERFLEPHMRGERDFSWQIWTLLSFQKWHNQLEN